MKLLHLVRHGEAEGNAGRAVGHLDLPLSDLGARRIEALAETWQGPPPDRLVASDLRRAADSAAILSGRLGAPLVTDPRLRELSFGVWEGCTWDEIYRRDPSHFAAWGERWWEVAPPGGETFDDLTRRVLAWFRELGGEVIVAVAHGGSFRALLTGLLKVPREQVFDVRLDCARVSALSFESTGTKLVSINQSRFSHRLRG